MLLWKSSKYYISECVFIAVPIHHAQVCVLYNIVICGLFWLYNIYPRYFLNGTIFGKMLLILLKLEVS